MNGNLVNTKEKQEDIGIDRFRYIAAILIIMIHTSPLESINELADYILTRELARVAVPFFFMVTGYYVVFNCFMEGTDSKFIIVRMLKKLGSLYLLLSILYLPLRIYSKYYKNGSTIGTVIRDFTFDGTFYHLWYLSAVMLGTILIYLLSKKRTSRQVFILSGSLYLIGLFGDSYYGLIKGSVIGKMYEGMFHVFSYTRNGIFFAPVFLMMGVYLHERNRTKEKNQEKWNGSMLVCFLSLSLFILVIEGLFLHMFELQRHDSMYFMLLPTMFLGYQLLLMVPHRHRFINRKVPMLV